MRLVSHRGNITGPCTEENSPRQIETAISCGYYVEVDVWLWNNEIWFGHDTPTYLVDVAWCNKNFLNIIFHAKNLPALKFFIDLGFNVFWHENDERTLTSYRDIWTYPGCETCETSIVVLQEPNGPCFDIHYSKAPLGGICTDYPFEHRKFLANVKP